MLQALSSELTSPPWGIYTPQACYARGAHPVSSSGQEIKTICPQPQHVSSCDWVDADPAQTLSVPRDTSYRALVKPSGLRGRLGPSPPGDAGSTRQGQQGLGGSYRGPQAEASGQGWPVGREGSDPLQQPQDGLKQPARPAKEPPHPQHRSQPDQHMSGQGGQGGPW